MSFHEEQIRHTAQAIRKAYCETKAAKLRKKNGYKLPSRWSSYETWNKAAACCEALGADPYAFVEACFENCTLSVGPYPNMLYGRAAERWWRESHTPGEDDGCEEKNILAHVAGILAQSARIAKVMGSTPKDVLLNDTMNSPIYLYLALRAIGAVEEGREKMGTAVWDILMKNPAKKKAVAEMVPGLLEELAE